MKNFSEYKSFDSFVLEVRGFLRKNAQTKLSVRAKEGFAEATLTFPKPIGELTSLLPGGPANFPMNNVLASKQAKAFLLEKIPELKETDLIFSATADWMLPQMTVQIFSPLNRKKFDIGDVVTLLPISNLPGGKLLPTYCEEGFKSKYVDRPARIGRRRMRGYASDVGVYMYDRVSLSHYRFVVHAIHPDHYSLIPNQDQYNEDAYNKEIQICVKGSEEWAHLEQRYLYQDNEWFIPDYAISREVITVPLETRNSITGRFIEVPAQEKNSVVRRIQPVMIQTFANVFQKFAEVIK